MTRPPRKKRVKLPVPRYPMATEQKYRRDLKQLVRELKYHCKTILYPQLESWVAGTAPLHTDAEDDYSSDDWQAELDAALEKIKNRLKPTTKETIEAAREHGKAVDANNKRDWQRTIRAAYGVNPTRHDQERYDRLLEQWGGDNARLITNIPVKATDQIRDDVIEALQSGTTVSDLQDIIQERIDVSDSRAELIARDQIGKLNGDLTKERHAESNVSKYIWQTVGDERVRDTHKDCDGETFTWDGQYSDDGIPKPDGNDPGGDYQCRCFAVPILPSFMSMDVELQDVA
jgi:SPP1 gp7 family putative phage head morphogenesis protein